MKQANYEPLRPRCYLQQPWSRLRRKTRCLLRMPMIDGQLKEIYIDGTPRQSTRPNGIRPSCSRIIPSAGPSAKRLDDPDQQFFETLAAARSATARLLHAEAD